MANDKAFHQKKRGKLQRKSKKIRKYNNSILIVCEGEKTEPNYFNSFPITNIEVKAIGTGRNTESLVDEAIRKWIEFASEDEFYEKLWCVFDRDSFSKSSYDRAFQKVEIEKQKLNRKYKKKAGRLIDISIAYSNEAFELWYLLHFDYINTALSRSQYKDMLTIRMGKKYKKNDPNIYYFLENLAQETNNQKGQNFAIKNAKQLIANVTKCLARHSNPSTEVYLLVEELNSYMKK